MRASAAQAEKSTPPRRKKPARTPFVIYPRLGSKTPDPRPPQGPGLLLSGGAGHVASAYAWMQRLITGGAPSGGDVVILRATEDDTYSPAFLKAASFNSVQTLCVPANATKEELAQAAAIVSKAHAVFFSGGQQQRYVQWKNSSLSRAVQAVYAKGGVVGGTPPPRRGSRWTRP
jgi:cyanophycinase